MSQFYSVESGAKALGIRERQFYRSSEAAGVKPTLVKKHVGHIGGASVQGFYSEKQIEQIRQYRLTGKRVNPIQVEVTVMPKRPWPLQANLKGLERVCLHCPHAQHDGSFKCCQCGEPCSGRELTGVMRSSMAYV